jgi:flavodoxin
MEKLERKITILYGSQTGCAKEVAERIQRDSLRRYFKVTISSMNNYNYVKKKIKKKGKFKK